MKKINLLALVAVSMILTACASYTSWSPTVDAYNDPNAHRIHLDMEQCRQLASQASGGVAKETAIGAGVGGLIGAAGGAAIGAITGNPASGAAIGAAAGGIGGAAKQGIQSDDQYKNAFRSCMRQRGHTVIN